MAYRNRYHLEPLRVTATLRTGVIADRWLPLDGILYYHVYRDRYGSPDSLLSGADLGRPVELPLLRIPFEVDWYAGEPSAEWYYACSWAQPQPWWIAEGSDHWNKKFDSELAHLIDFRGRRGLVPILGGTYKAKHMPIFYYIAQRIEWHAIGDASEVRALLACATHIGKHTAAGWGRVTAWEVEPWPEDWSVQREGRLMRGVPPGHAVGEYVVENYGFRPPYFVRANQMDLAAPR